MMAAQSAADRRDGTSARLDDVLITDALARRPSRAPDLRAENETLHALAQLLADRPQAMLRKLATVALELCQAGSAGVSLLEEAGSEGVFRWAALAGAYEGHEGGTTPRAASPCGTCLDRRAPQLYAQPARYFPCLHALAPPIAEGLVIPLYTGSRPQGTIWVVAHDDDRRFDAEDARLMAGLGGFTAAALATMFAREAAVEAVVQEQAARARADAGSAASARDALLLANVRDSVIVTDLDGVITSWNDGATRLFGWTAAEMLGRPYADRFPEPVRPRIAAEIRARAAGTEWTGEFEDYRKDGTRVWIDARVCCFTNAAGIPAGILGLAHDISDRKRAEEALREADRNKDRFLLQLGHELRNPLATLRHALLLLRAPDGQDREETLDLAERQQQQMTRLVDDMLDLSRIAQGKVELRTARIDLAATAARAVEAARPALEARGHELAVALAPAPLWLDGDAPRLEQVLVNLLANAAKYTNPGGRVWLTVRREEDEAVVRVRDTGIGLDAAMLPRVFDLYAQAEGSRDHAAGGLGIGLALVRGLVELHGGKVEAHSDGPGRGSEFVVRLPARARAVPAEVPTAPAAAVASERPLQILVVDDNRDGAASLGRLLQRWGHRVDLAHDGPAALATAQASRPEVVLLDIGLPGMGGHEVARRLRREGREGTLLIALTGYGGEEDRRRSRESGFDQHWVKPVNLDVLRELLAGFRPRAEAGS